MKNINKYLSKSKGIIHVGASVGQERKIYAKLNVPVIWIEPIPEIFKQLKKNISNFPKQRAFNYLITDVDDKEYPFYIMNKRGESSSILEPKEHLKAWPHIKVTDIIKLKSITLNSFFKKENIDINLYDTLIMDTQGSELMVLKGLDLTPFRYIKTEASNFEMYKGGCFADEIDAYIRKRGFKKIASRSYVSIVNGKVVVGGKNGYNCSDFVYEKMLNSDSFGSHIPILVKVLEKTNGKVLDLGIGISTWVIHAMAKKTKRQVVSYEKSPDWYEKHICYQTDWHDIRLVDDWDDIDIDNDFWDVALVDHHPAKRRRDEVRRLANNCNYILLHDADLFAWHYGKSKIYDLFKYKYEYKDCSPTTMVLSNFKDLSDL